jgi:hypothetical protein
LQCDSNKKGIAKSKNNSISFEGKFIKIEKINHREYYLFLKGDTDTVTTFITLMPINTNEIQLLKKDGNNIKLCYSNFYNPVRKTNEKMVKKMEPIYEFENK